MDRKYWIVIGIILVGLVAATGAVIFQGSQSVTINIDTDGEDITVTSSTMIFSHAPTEMEKEIADYTAEVLKDADSTVESIKTDVSRIAENYGYTSIEVNIKSQFGEDQLPMPAVVSGDSMYPTLKDGQDLIVLKTKDIKVNDIVIARHPEYDLIVKRVGKIQGDKVYLMSDNKKVETIYQGNYIITKTPLNTWVNMDDIVGVVKDY